MEPLLCLHLSSTLLFPLSSPAGECPAQVLFPRALLDNPTHRPSFQSLFKGGIRRKLLGVIDGGGGLVAKSPPTLAAPRTVTCLAPLSVGFPRQEYWSGLPFPSPRSLPDPGIKSTSPVSPALAGEFTGTTWQYNCVCVCVCEGEIF